MYMIQLTRCDLLSDWLAARGNWVSGTLIAASPKTLLLGNC